MLRLQGASFAYGDRPVLRDLDLTLTPGDHLCLLGNNGAGKSTLLRILAGILPPSAGAATLDGRPLHAWTRREVARRLAYLPQEGGPRFGFTALEVVLMGRYAHARGAFEGPSDIAAARQAMERTDCWHLGDRRFPELSGGERRRVLLSQALAQDCPLLLLDEPTAGLDPAHALAIGAVLAQVAAAGRAVLWSTHDLNLAARFAREAALLHEGRLALLGPTEGVLGQAGALLGVGLHLGRLPSGAPFAVPA